ncbi:hypothetical protein D3C81_376450 [compost metagenome]
MKLLKLIYRFFFPKQRVQASDITTQDVLQHILRYGHKTLPDPYYTPLLYEPSPFDLKDGIINPYWLSWYMDRHGVTLSTAMIAGHCLKKNLVAEIDPPIPNTVPDILVEVGTGVDKRLCLSLAWVQWYRNSFGVSYMEAHYQGILMTTRHEGKQA